MVTRLKLLFLIFASLDERIRMCEGFVPHATSKVTRHSYPTQLMALQVTIRMVGTRKTSGPEPHFDKACQVYKERLRSTMSIDTVVHKNDAALIQSVEQDDAKNHQIVLLDVAGKRYTSEKLATTVYEWLETGGSRMTWVIGAGKTIGRDSKVVSNTL